jgi:hypothetical protein
MTRVNNLDSVKFNTISILLHLTKLLRLLWQIEKTKKLGIFNA